jgi:predicted enzyme related to lactoylglutathione lyase
VELVQARLVTEDVAGLAAFYAGLVGAAVPLNEYYVEVPAGAMSVGFSKRRFEHCPDRAACRGAAPPPRAVILDFLVRDVDAEYPRIARLGVGWVLPPATQPWGSRSMIFHDPEGNLINVFSRP